MGVAARQLLRIPEIPCPACEERWTQSTGKQLRGAKRAAGCQGPGTFMCSLSPAWDLPEAMQRLQGARGKQKGQQCPGREQ